MLTDLLLPPSDSAGDDDTLAFAMAWVVDGATAASFDRSKTPVLSSR